MRRLLVRLLRLAAGATRRASRTFSGLEARAATPALAGEDHRRRQAAAMAAHDMVDDPDEAYYRDRYVDWLDATVAPREHGGRWLDAGCGSGRMTRPLAERLAAAGGSVVAVDFLEDSIDRAREHLAGLDNVELRVADLLADLASTPADAYDGALLLEVGFVIRDLPGLLDELRRVLRPSAPLLVSLRTRWFHLARAAAAGDWDTAPVLIESTGARLPGMGWQNWCSAEEACELLRSAGFDEISVRGLGGLSGVAGDPLAAVARPASLAPRDREILSRMEDAVGRELPGAGRYLLLAARRKLVQ